MAVLPVERVGRALEVGCAAGHLTERLAGRCGSLLACDVDPRAVALTRERLDGRADPGTGSVVVEQRWLPRDWPEGRFDLVVLSEVAYYLDAADLAELVRLTAAALGADGTLVLCHWRHDAPGYPGTAAGVRDAVAGAGLARVVAHEEPDLLLDVWTAGEPSVARREGWLA